MSSCIWIHPLHNCSYCNYWVSTPLKWILKVLHWICVCGAWFQTLLAKSIWRGRCAAKGAPLGASLTWTPPSWANHNTASCQKGKGVLTIIQTLPFHIVFGKSFPPHFFFFLVQSACSFLFVLGTVRACPSEPQSPLQCQADPVQVPLAQLSIAAGALSVLEKWVSPSRL